MQARIIWTISILVLAAAVAGFYLMYEKVEEEIWVGPSSEAKRNPFLAAQRFLTERGVTVVETTSELRFSELPASATVILSQVDTMLVSSSQIDAAVDWVQRGGSLIVGVGAEVTGHDSLLSRFDLQPRERNFDFDEVIDEAVEELSASERMREVNRKLKEQEAADELATKERSEDGDVGDAPQPESTETSQVGNSTESTGKKTRTRSDFNRQLFELLNVELDYEYYPVFLNESHGEVYLAVLDELTFTHPDIDYEDYQAATSDSADSSEKRLQVTVPLEYQLVASISDEAGVRLLQFELGEGRFTAISSSDLWRNDSIGLADHAYFLSYMVPSGSTLHFFYNVDVASLGSVLLTNFPEFIYLALITLGLWLWRHGLRSQRIHPVVEGQRRNFSEHLSASARYLVANKQWTLLIESIKEDIELQMRVYDANFSRLPAQTQINLLAKQTDIPTSHIERWLAYCNQLNNQDELFAALKLGHLIRKKL